MAGNAHVPVTYQVEIPTARASDDAARNVVDCLRSFGFKLPEGPRPPLEWTVVQDIFYDIILAHFQKAVADASETVS